MKGHHIEIGQGKQIHTCSISETTRPDSAAFVLEMERPLLDSSTTQE
jgi:hypothetical protein